MAFPIVLESTTSPERVALILHHVFGYSLAEAAEVVGQTPASFLPFGFFARLPHVILTRDKPQCGGHWGGFC